MKLQELGEFGIIDFIAKQTRAASDKVVAGIGDDAAIIRVSPEKLLAITTDMLVEKVHFDLQTITAAELGYKAVAVNISDLAAMGAVPGQIVVALGLRPELSVEFVKELYRGMQEICQEFQVDLVGGDTVSSPCSLSIAVTAVGEVAEEKWLLRSGAKPGDILAVTGTLGDSAAGLAVMKQEDWENQPFAKAVRQAHVRPCPQVEASRWLAFYGATSCNDISDGLASETHEIAKASQVGVLVRKEAIPISAAARAAADWCGDKALDYALYGGEDFQLLFSMPQDRLETMQAEHPEIAVTSIGQILPLAQGVQLLLPDNTQVKLCAAGYNHFATEKEAEPQTEQNFQLKASTPQATQEIGLKLAPLLQAGDVLALTGDLGAGKTFFSQAIVKALIPGCRANSPTFTLLNVYQAEVPIYHFDLYRLEEEEQLTDIGFSEYVGRHGIALIEWADKFPGTLPEDCLHICLRRQDEECRLLEFIPSGPRSDELCKELKEIVSRD